MAEDTDDADTGRPADLRRLDALERVAAPEGPCEACGSPQAKAWSTPDGPARLCPPCATLNGIGCP